MDITGEYRLAADRQKVWDALQDPDTLQACIPGCEALEKVSDEQVDATIMAAIGPVKSRFKTVITLSEMEPPQSYRMSGEGKGGAAGFGRGSALVTLAEDGGNTVLTYEADLKVGGKLAQVGSRLVLGVTRKIADQFFDTFAERIGAVPAAAEADEEAVASTESEGASGGGGAWKIVVGAIAAGAILWFLFGRG